MCVRHTYYCHGCRQCFGVPLLSTFDQRLNKFWYFVCRSREPENVLVDLFSNPHWRRVESNAVPLGCPIKRAERLLSEERNRLLGERIRERIRQLIAAPQGESLQLPRSRG